MRSVKLLGLALISLAALPLVACSADSTEEPSPSEEVGAQDDNKKNKSPSSPATSDDQPTGTPSATPPGEENPPATETPPSSTPPSEKPNTTTCTAARDVGKLSGDTGSPSMTVQGKCGEWLRLRVTEDQVTSALAAGEKLTVTLIPPTGSDFDLFVHMTSEADVVDCVTPKMTSSEKGDKTEMLKLVWGESYTANNADDSRNVAIEVRSKSGTCAEQTWSLLLQGNQ